METTDAFRGLACTGCGASFDAGEHGRCPSCGGSLDPTYDYDGVDPTELVADRTADRPGHWRFDALLPFPADTGRSANEGDTPLVRTDRLTDELDVGAAHVKDEGRNPTGTFIDRGMSLAVTAASDRGLEPLALAAAGNAGQSAAAYAGTADLRSYAFVPSRAAFSNKAMVNVHGGDMRVVGGRYGDAAAAVDEQLETDYHSLQEFTTPYRHEGAKTVAFELFADLGVPDAVVAPVGTGELLVGLAKGFRELREIGASDVLPAIYAVQPEGCAPIAAAWTADADAVEPWDHPDTIVGELEIEEPAGGDRALDALAAVDGDALAVPDDEALESAVSACRSEVLEVGGAGGVALAGAWALADEDELGGDDEVVVVNPDAAGKTPDVLRSHLMGQGV
ncbi:threonine synthase [Halorarum halobium]|uniref:threonine synthase n=1 Tax=Halorarum halobium TaxID=3075121 RepID=UPI0028ABE3E1|nr:pyridoxal-phosphate dependent enzyme [Halobaculum sp. XH14]